MIQSLEKWDNSSNILNVTVSTLFDLVGYYGNSLGIICESVKRKLKAIVTFDFFKVKVFYFNDDFFLFRCQRSQWKNIKHNLTLRT